MKDGNVTVLSRPKKRRPIIVPFLVLIVALIYDLMPFDFIPDVPVVGWVDDLLITVAAIINFIEKTLLHNQDDVKSAVWKIKWVLIAFGTFSFLLMFAIIIAIIMLITR
ncbi:MAG: DUF1232 domain-containing protein [Candidatus Magnetoovum sp. WYHC-5]|nr:DUF1232 domain-containing protein [Candidatus Magnetoovum sp. WYHC-5]